jgi:hypothetical protein
LARCASFARHRRRDESKATAARTDRPRQHVGFVWGDADGEIRFHPDEAVVSAIRNVFARFAFFRYFLRYFSSTPRTDLSRFRRTFHSFDPVGFAIFAIRRALAKYPRWEQAGNRDQ